MGRFSTDGRNIAPAMRGQIVQRVLVDGWSPAKAAIGFGVGERQVRRWVAAYRRHGMASLRRDGGWEPLPLRLIRRFRQALREMLEPPAEALRAAKPAAFVPLHRHGGDRRMHP